MTATFYVACRVMDITSAGLDRILMSPNFFVLGAPKCGTTALYSYLQGNPQVFLPRIKEPHYYLTDVPGYPRITSTCEYASLFRKATPEHVAVGEASVFYLYSRASVPNILHDHPQAKFIVLLRDPISLVQSLHSQYLYGFYESEPSFEVAWRLQESRMHGENLPPHCSFPDLLQYGDVAKLGEQVERLLDHVPRERVLLLEFNDLQASSREVYLRVLDFLGVQDDGRMEFECVNGNRRHSRPWISRMLMHPPCPLNHLKEAAKKHLQLRDTWFMAWLYQRMLLKEKREPLSRDFEEILRDYFAADQTKLRQMLDIAALQCAA